MAEQYRYGLWKVWSNTAARSCISGSSSGANSLLQFLKAYLKSLEMFSDMFPSLP